MLEDVYCVEERHSCIAWDNEDKISQGPICRTLLQVEYDSSDGIRDFLGGHGEITACNKCGCGGIGIRKCGEKV